MVGMADTVRVYLHHTFAKWTNKPYFYVIGSILAGYDIRLKSQLIPMGHKNWFQKILNSIK